MRYVAAYLLLGLGGKASPSAADIKALLSSAGIESDDAQLNKVVGELSGKAIADVVAEGAKKLASVPSGGAAPAAGAAAAAGKGAAPAAAKAPEPEPEEEEAAMDFDLFG